MDAKEFVNMLSDKWFDNLEKMQHKYSVKSVESLIEILKSNIFTTLPIEDFYSQPIVYIENIKQINSSTLKQMLKPIDSPSGYGVNAMEDEIYSTLKIESIESTRDSIRRILNGYAPTTESENKIFGIKKGLAFIADKSNRITEENLHALYKMAIDDYLDEKNKLTPSNYYRNDDVFVVGSSFSHQGLHHGKLKEYMKKFIKFINTDSNMNDLQKAASIHFYLAYIHPYFDGNGRTARLLHLWYLIQQGYPSSLFVAFSSYINESRSKYYQSFINIEKNHHISGIIDITPFIRYFTDEVYNKLSNVDVSDKKFDMFKEYLDDGKITEKERRLWSFILSTYGENEFSTKQLEKDFQNAAYATIRGFVQKFEKYGLLHSQKYGSRIKYRV